MKDGVPTTFGVLADGREVAEYTLVNQSGIAARILTYGGIIRTLEVPDRAGHSADIVLGFDSLRHYEATHPYIGAIVGRVAGRISGGQLPLAGVQHQLSINASPNHLHGGSQGFDKKVWDAEHSASARSLMLTHVSAAEEEGYPGKLTANVTYTLSDDNALIVEYRATADAPTVVNLSQHSYFNLSGDASRSVLDHLLSVNSERVLGLDDHSIPTGKELDVAGTDFDFRKSRKIGLELDNYWTVGEVESGSRMQLAAEYRHAESGRILEVATTAPGLQIYTANQFSQGLIGKRGVPYKPGAGICFETQVHPNSPNRPEFPSITLGEGETYESTTEFRFRVS